MEPAIAVELLENWLDAEQRTISVSSSLDSAENEYAAYRKLYSMFKRYADAIRSKTDNAAILGTLNMRQAVLADTRHAAKKRAKRGK